MAKQTIWKEFPEINRKVAFSVHYTGIDTAYLGCHCGTIANICATLGEGYGAPENGKNIAVLDTTKEPELKYVMDRYESVYRPPKGEIQRITKYLRDKNTKFSDISEGAYSQLIDLCASCPLWVMSDVINGKAPARISDPTYAFEQVGSTCEFAQYLIYNKIGYVMASPIVQNPIHRGNTNYSLNQGWFWVHPNHLGRAVDVGGVYKGNSVFPTKEKWIDTVGKDLSIREPLPPTNGSMEEYILNRVFNSGVFAGEDPRFKVEDTGVPKTIRRKKIAVEA